MYASVHRGTWGYASGRKGTLTYMSEPPAEMSARDVRAHLADVLNAASVRGQTTYITNRGRRIAAVVPLSVAEAAEEHADDSEP